MSEQVSQVEEELNKDWKEKCDHLLASAQEKHQRELQDVLSEKQLLKEKVEYLEKRVNIFFLVSCRMLSLFLLLSFHVV